MGIIKRRWIWLKRFRHRCGYGVHSPFAFGFLTGVVYERGEYYAYRGLACRHFPGVFRRAGHAAGCCKFLFRLANYVHPSVIRICGEADEAVCDYLQAGCLSARLVRAGLPCSGQLPAETSPADELLYVAADVPPAGWTACVDSVTTERSVCLLCGIHASAAALQQWERAKRHPRVSVSFDLYDYGILFFDSSKQNQHYIVNF